jgi:hypothetical protein
MSSSFFSIVTFGLFIVKEMEVSLASEMTHIEDLIHYLTKNTVDPNCLPNASEQVIKDIKGIDYSTIVAFKVRFNCQR